MKGNRTLKTRYVKTLIVTDRIFMALPYDWVQEFGWVEYFDKLPNGKKVGAFEVYPVLVLKQKDTDFVFKTGFLIMNLGEEWKRGELPTFGGVKPFVIKLVDDNI